MFASKTWDFDKSIEKNKMQSICEDDTTNLVSDTGSQAGKYMTIMCVATKDRLSRDEA